ncbi:hypothetical protein PT282_06075 [Bifidobacterium sp. ESL0763]|uniref:hypothetical protein n=1 Tax=Bifidobacterium sp. ESL0763 TaxID=2983227 RepID=UPI0023F8D6B5|nr:hypothetical protein [Bifidobacterium sp. ESL0763]MDF7664226.1 hypothetical protein [Bifidobacterium sp. ESL0763]
MNHSKWGERIGTTVLVSLIVFVLLNALIWFIPVSFGLYNLRQRYEIPALARRDDVQRLYPSCVRGFEPDALTPGKRPVIRSYAIDTTRKATSVNEPGDRYYRLTINGDKDLWLPIKISGGDVSGAATDQLSCSVDYNNIPPKMTKLMLRRYGRCTHEYGDLRTPYTDGVPVCVDSDGYVNVNPHMGK